MPSRSLRLKLKTRFQFGKWIQLQEKATEYGGRTIRQQKDFSFKVSMVRYLEERARTIELPRGRCKDLNAQATDSEITALRGLLGKLNWAAREAMPNGSGDAYILAATLPKPQVKHLVEANQTLKHLLEAKAVIHIKAIPLDRIRLLTFSDSSL